jgi:hypothetical protein
MERTAWTDERLDDSFGRLYEELRGLRSDFSNFQDRMIQIGFGLVGVLIAGIVTLTVTLVVALA